MNSGCLISERGTLQNGQLIGCSSGFFPQLLKPLRLNPLEILDTGKQVVVAMAILLLDTPKRDARVYTCSLVFWIATRFI
jgi:hypothetical protein